MKVILFLILIFNFLMADSLTFGVVPQQSPEKLYRVWHPIIEKLSKELGIEVIFKTEKSIPQFEKKLYNREYDIAYMNPYHYTVANKFKYQALIRANKDIKGILVVKKDSHINSLKDVVDKNFIFPAPFAFAATLLTKYEVLKDTNYSIDKSKKLMYVNSHDSVYKGVARGIGEVGGGIKRTFNLMSPEIKEKLKIIHTTKNYPSHPIAIKSDLPNSIKNKLKEFFLSLDKENLKDLNVKNFIEINDSEYDTIRGLVKDLNIKE